MSKKLIAGLGTVAALGIAALPLAGTFAAVDGTADTIVRVKVVESVQCYTSDAATADNFVWFGEVPVGVTKSEAFTAYGATNSANGFTMTGTPTNLLQGTLVGDEDDRDAVFTETQNGSTIDYATTAGDGKWWVTTPDASGVAIGSTIVLTGNGTAQTGTFNLTANVRPAYTNPAGIYQGEINWVCSVKQ